MSWVPPRDAGGCRITSYAVYRDDGLGGNIDHKVHSDVVKDMPSLDLLAVTDFPDSSVGRTFRF